MARVMNRLRASLHGTKIRVSVLCLGVAVLHPFPARTLYHCRVSGAYLADCCCKGETRCSERSPSEPMPCCRTAEKPASPRGPVPEETVLGNDPCGCCDVIVQEGTSVSFALLREQTETRAGKTFSFFSVPPDTLQSALFVCTPSCPSPILRLKIPYKGPPFHILHSSFLC